MLEQTKFNELKNDFINKYTRDFLPEIKTVKNKRKTVNIILISMGIAAIIGIIVFIFAKAILVKSISIVVAAVLALGAYKILNIFKEKARDEIMQKYAKTLECIAYRWGKYPDKMVIKRACMINYFENANIFNTFFGTYSDIDYEIVECSLRNKLSVFDGLIIRIKLNKPNEVHTVIRLDNANFAATRPTLRPINYENLGIDKKYHVYSENENDAKAYVQQGLIQQLENLEKGFNMPFFGAAICRGDLLIALQNKTRLFDMYPVLKDRPQAFEQFSNFFKDLVALYELIEFCKDK